MKFDADALTDDQLARTLVTMIFIVAGHRGLTVLLAAVERARQR